jgi:hypothetical protein
VIVDHCLALLQLLEFLLQLNVVDVALFESVFQLFLPLDHLVGTDLHVSYFFLQDLIFIGAFLKRLLLFYQFLLMFFELKVILLNLLKPFVHRHTITFRPLLNLLDVYRLFFVFLPQVLVLPPHFELFAP